MRWEGSGSGFENSSGGGAGAGGGGVWVGPSWAQARNLGSKKIPKIKLSKSKFVLPKMLARSGLVGKNPPGPIWGYLKPFSPWTENNPKMLRIFLGGPMGPIHPVWALAAIHPGWGNR